MVRDVNMYRNRDSNTGRNIDINKDINMNRNITLI